MNPRSSKQSIPHHKNGTPQTLKSAKDKFTYPNQKQAVSSDQQQEVIMVQQAAPGQLNSKRKQQISSQQQTIFRQNNQELKSKRTSQYQQTPSDQKEKYENPNYQISDAYGEFNDRNVQALSKQKSQKLGKTHQELNQESVHKSSISSNQKLNPQRETNRAVQSQSGYKQQLQQINRLTSQVQPIKLHQNRPSLLSQESQGHQKSQKNTPSQYEPRVFEYKEDKKNGGNGRTRAKNFSQFSNERNLLNDDIEEEVTYRENQKHEQENYAPEDKYQEEYEEEEEEDFEAYGKLLISQQNPLYFNGKNESTQSRQSSQNEMQSKDITQNMKKIQKNNRASEVLQEKTGASRESHQRINDRLKKSSTTAYLNYNQQTQGQMQRRNMTYQKNSHNNGAYLVNEVSQPHELVSVSSRGSNREQITKHQQKNQTNRNSDMMQDLQSNEIQLHLQKNNIRGQAKKDRLSLGSLNHIEEENIFQPKSNKQQVRKLNQKQSLLSPIRSQQILLSGMIPKNNNIVVQESELIQSISETNKDSGEVITSNKSNERRQLKNLRQGRLELNQERNTGRLKNEVFIQSQISKDDRQEGEAQYRNESQGLNRLSSLSKDREYDRESLINYKSGKNSKMEERLEERAQKIKQRLQKDQRRIIQIEDSNQSRIQSTSNLPSLTNPQILNSKSSLYQKRQSNQSFAEGSNGGFNHLSNQVHDLLVSTPLSHFEKPTSQFLHRNNSIDQHLDVSSRNLNQRRNLKSIADPSQDQRADQNFYLKENFSVRNLRNQYKSNDSQIYSRGNMRQGQKREDLQGGNHTTVNQRIKQRMNGSMDSFDNFGEATGIIQNVPDEDLQEDDEPMFAGSQDSKSNKKITKLQTQYRINLPKVNKKGLQIIINKDQTQTIVGNIQKLNHKFQNQTVKLESILPNSSQTISKRNFERNLKNANEEIIRLRQELNEKNKLLEKIAQTEIRSQRVERSIIQSSSQMRDTIGMSMGQPKSVTRGDNQTQLLAREYSLSGLEMNSERKSTDNTFRVRKINLKRQNTEQELQRANSQPILISRRNVIFKPDDQNFNNDLYHENQFRSQTNLNPMQIQDNNNSNMKRNLLETSERLSSAQMLPSINGGKSFLKSQEQTPVQKQSLTQLQPLNTSLNFHDQISKNSLNDPRIRKYKQNTQAIDQQMNGATFNSNIQGSSELHQLKLQIQSSQNQANTIKNADLDVLEERDELEEDGDKLTREGFFKNELDSEKKQKKGLSSIPSHQGGDQFKKSSIIVQSSSQGLTNSQLKSTGVTLNRNGSEWGVSSTQTKFQSISTPSNLKQKASNLKEKNKKSNLIIQRQGEKSSLKQTFQNRVSIESNEEEDGFIYEDEEELINPVSDEISPQQSIDNRANRKQRDTQIDAFKPEAGIAQKMYETPKRGFQKLNKKQVKVKSSFELLQEIQKNNDNKQINQIEKQNLRDTSTHNSKVEKQDSPNFGQNVVDYQMKGMEAKAFEYQPSTQVADFGMLTMTDLSKALQNQESANNQASDEIDQASIPSNQQNSSPMPNLSKDLQQLELNQQPSLDAQAKRFQVFYEDDIDDEFVELNSSPEQDPRRELEPEDEGEPIKYEDHDDISFEEQLEDGSTPQIFAETLYHQNTQGNKFIQFQLQIDDQEQNQNQQYNNPFIVSAAQSEELKESMDFVGSLNSARLKSKNDGQDPFNIRSSQAYMMERNNNLRASAIRYSSKDTQLNSYQSHQQLKLISDKKQPRKLPFTDEEEELCQYQYSNSLISTSQYKDKNDEINEIGKQLNLRQVQEFTLEAGATQRSELRQNKEIKQQEGILDFQI